MNIKKTLIAEVRYLSENAHNDMARLTQFAYENFTREKANELVDEMKKSPEHAENWMIKNY
jgi:hypothetical protein